jgi:hypothetical protein
MRNVRSPLLEQSLEAAANGHVRAPPSLLGRERGVRERPQASRGRELPASPSTTEHVDLIRGRQCASKIEGMHVGTGRLRRQSCDDGQYSDDATLPATLVATSALSVPGRLRPPAPWSGTTHQPARHCCRQIGIRSQESARWSLNTRARR